MSMRTPPRSRNNTRKSPISLPCWASRESKSYAIGTAAAGFAIVSSRILVAAGGGYLALHPVAVGFVRRALLGRTGRRRWRGSHQRGLRNSLGVGSRHSALARARRIAAARLAQGFRSAGLGRDVGYRVRGCRNRNAKRGPDLYDMAWRLVTAGAGTAAAAIGVLRDCGDRRAHV